MNYIISGDTTSDCMIVEVSIALTSGPIVEFASSDSMSKANSSSVNSKRFRRGLIG